MRLINPASIPVLFFAAVIVVAIPAFKWGTFVRLGSDPSVQARRQRIRLGILLASSPGFTLFIVGAIFPRLALLALVGLGLAVVSILGYTTLALLAVVRGESIQD